MPPIDTTGSYCNPLAEGAAVVPPLRTLEFIPAPMREFDFHSLLHRTAKVKLLHPKAKPPVRSYPDDVGWDVFAITDQILRPRETTMVGVGIAIEPPSGKWYQGETRGSSAKAGLIVVGGINDPNYRGEFKAMLYNGGDEPYWICEGDKIMQLVERDTPVTRMILADELSSTDRGAGGFGSTGR